MRIPNKPSDTIHKDLQTNRTGLLNAFAKEIIHGNVVLLLGHESLLRIPSEEEAIRDETLQALRDCNGSMEQWMSYLKTQYYDNHKFRTLKDFNVYMFEDYNDSIPRLDSDEMNPEIRKLIESKAFRIVLTTTYDPLIEEVMENTWGGKGSVDIKNFGDGDKDKKDLTGVDRIVLSNDVKPTLYYLFGKATNEVSNYGNPQFIVDEEDYIQMIRDWMVAPPKRLMSFLANKRILAVGCKFENWLFRFFWRAILEAKKNSDDFKHLLAISLTSSPSDQKLKEIFKLYNLKYPEDVNEFLKGLNRAIEIQKEKAISEERKQGGIFLSYCSKDYPRVLNLFYKLHDLGFNVWIDRRDLEFGDEYKKNISAAINNCTVFVPVLSREVASHSPATDPYDENDSNYHFYRDFEWDHAVVRYKNDRNSLDPSTTPLAIIPFALEDYNPRQNNVPEDVRKAYPLIFEKTLEPYNNAGFVCFVQTLKKLIK